jgi:hypothetical protein
VAAKTALLNGNLLEFFTYVDKLRGCIPYYHAPHFKKETAFLVQLYQVLWIMEIDFACEESSAKGRSDLVLYTPNPQQRPSAVSGGTLYVLELKAFNVSESNVDRLQKEALSAIAQITSTSYLENSLFAKKYRGAREVYVAVLAADLDEKTRRFALLALRKSGQNESQTEFYTINDNTQ